MKTLDIPSMLTSSSTLAEKEGGVAEKLTGPREVVRRALLDATGDLIARYGYRKTAVEDIARAAGVSRATAYLYFSSKDDLVLGWIAQRSEEQIEMLQNLPRAEGASALEHAAAVLLARVLTRFDSVQPFTESIDELLAVLRSRVLVQREQHYEAEAMVIAKVLNDGTAKGEIFLFADSLATARLLILGTNALLPYSLSARQLGKRSEVEARARGLITLLLGGLHPEKGRENTPCQL